MYFWKWCLQNVVHFVQDAGRKVISICELKDGRGGVCRVIPFFNRIDVNKYEYR